MKFFSMLFVYILFTSTSFAIANYSGIAQELYPANAEDKAFVVKFFEIVESQKTDSPFFNGRGPSVSEYSLNKLRFAYMTNETTTTIDLVIFNWGSLETFDGLVIEDKLSQMYGSTVYSIKNLNKQLIASQGKNHDQFSNWSYLTGSQQSLKRFKVDYPQVDPPDEFFNWKPHPEFMDRSHPFRKALGSESIGLINPSQKIWFRGLGFDEMPAEEIRKAIFKANGGYFRYLMGTVIHEMYHVKETSDIANSLVKKRKMNLDGASFISQLENDNGLTEMLCLYIKIVFSISKTLKQESPLVADSSQLADLAVVITQLKSQYREAWKYIWDFEYIEGFAEYTGAFSMIQGQVTTLSEEIDNQITSKTANFAYRTGTLAGLYLRYRIKKMPFDQDQDKALSPWELIIKESSVNVSNSTLDEIRLRYSKVLIDQNYEIKRITDYLQRYVVPAR